MCLVPLMAFWLLHTSVASTNRFCDYFSEETKGAFGLPLSITWLAYESQALVNQAQLIQ
jgi:hypothetical protein